MIRQAVVHAPHKNKAHECAWCKKQITGLHYLHYGGEEFTANGRPVEARVCLQCLWSNIHGDYETLELVRFVYREMNLSEKRKYLWQPVEKCDCGQVEFDFEDYCEWCHCYKSQLKV